MGGRRLGTGALEKGRRPGRKSDALAADYEFARQSLAAAVARAYFSTIEDMRLLEVHVVGEQATELVHIGLIAMLAGVGASLFNRVCFNYPTLSELYKVATYAALLKRAGLFSDGHELDR